MEQINAKELSNEAVYPDDTVLKMILGESFDAYCSLLRLYDENEMSHEWRYYKDGKAWLCKVRYKKRTIAWMSAWKGYMKATIYIPEKYFALLDEVDMSEGTKAKIVSANNVGKSKPCMFEIRDKEVLKDFERVMRFKMIMK